MGCKKGVTLVKRTLLAAGAAVFWSLVSFAIIGWLNEVDLGPMNLHIALNLVIWLGGMSLVVWLVLRRATPSQLAVSATSRLKAVGWFLVVLAICLAVLSAVMVRSSKPFATLMRSGADRMTLVLIVAFTLFAVMSAIEAGLVFRFVRLPSSLGVRALRIGGDLLVATNVLVLLAGAYAGYAQVGATIVIGAYIRNMLPPLAEEVLREE